MWRNEDESPYDGLPYYHDYEYVEPDPRSESEYYSTPSKLLKVCVWIGVVALVIITATIIGAFLQ